jgi:hypothetical protein
MREITTKISRQEMVIAKRTYPKYKRKMSAAQRIESSAMLDSIIRRMNRLVYSMCRSAYNRFQHGTDRSVSLEDLIATVNAGLVIGIYRYKRNGKYEPYNYLMGVINIVLRNMHNWRNRKKRIPPTLLLSLDANTSTSNDADICLANSISSSSETSSPIERSSIRWRKKNTNKKNKDINVVPMRMPTTTVSHERITAPAVLSDMEMINRLSLDIYNIKIGNITSMDVLKMLISGHPVRVVAEAAGVGLTRMRKFIKKNITEPLIEAVI